MKKLRKITLVATLLAVTISCHKDDEPTPQVIPECGCESLSTGNITETIGVLKKDSNNNYFIQIGDGLSVSYFYEICNTSFITLNVPNNGINVKFTGSLSKNCKMDEILPPNYNYYNIKLTQIQTQ